MTLRNQISFLFRIVRPYAIARRYFVTNGFDGALTMLGLISGFYVSGTVDLRVAVNACLGAAVALAMSGITSAYISEAAERARELHDLERAMIADLDHTAHGQAARLVPLIIAVVNGIAPLAICLVIACPLWLSLHHVHLPVTPVEASVLVAFGVIFSLGVFLGRVSGTFWLWSGLRTVLVGLATSLFILAMGF